MMSPVLTVTMLTVNGVETPSYTANVYFIWKDGELDETKAINGERFAIGTTSATSAADLSRRSAAAYATGASASVTARSNRREEMMKRMTQEGQVSGTPVINTDGY